MDYNNNYLKTYWKYYLLLENRLIKTSEYVEFDDVNNDTYSIEYLSLLQTICSEIDVVGKAIALYFNKSFNVKKANIMKWGYVIQKNISDITTQSTIFLKEKTITPWKNWNIEERKDKKNRTYLAFVSGCKTPDWWSAYNAVKHARTTILDGRINYHKANQKNVVNALAALYILNRLMMIKLDDNLYRRVDKSRLFILPYRNDDADIQLFVNQEGDPCVEYSDDMDLVKV